ncbi:MAG: hypothetical protein AB8G14_07645 [Ilumatobacter sp.]
MITLCHAAKGGSGTTIVACLRAIDTIGPTLLIDLEGDVPGMLGLAEPARPGVLEWLASNAPIAHLDDLLVETTPTTLLLPARSSGSSATCVSDDEDRWQELVDWIIEWAHDSGGSVVVDAGTTALPTPFVERCDHRWLVTRACYLSLRRAGRLHTKPTGVILIDEPGRALSQRDIETAVRAPVIVTIPWDIRVARSIDSGLLTSHRLPRSIHRTFARVAA